MTFTNRLGSFFLIIGAALVGLFILSDMGDKPLFGYFFFGLVSVVLGLYLRWRSPNPPPPPSGRFGMVKQMSQKGAPKPGFKFSLGRKSVPPQQNRPPQGGPPPKKK